MSIATRIDMATTRTLVCDIIDVYPNDARLLDPVFADFGGVLCFHGPVSTLKCFEDNLKLREAVHEQGHRRVLVVDGGGSLRHALLGGNLAATAAANGWAGIIIHGAVRDVAELEDVAIGIKALAPCPRSSYKNGHGARDVLVHLAGQTIKAGDYIYADGDGIIVTTKPLHV